MEYDGIAQGGTGDAKGLGSVHEEVRPFAKAALRPGGVKSGGGAVMEPMIVEEAGPEQYGRSSRKASRYYTGAGWANRFTSRFSQIGVAK